MCYRYDMLLATCLHWPVSCERQGYSAEINGSYGSKLQHVALGPVNLQSDFSRRQVSRIYLGKGFNCCYVGLGSTFWLSYLSEDICVYVHVCTQNFFSVFFWQKQFFRCYVRLNATFHICKNAEILTG